jgi:rhodanese-related sulfurtransferase
LKLAQWTVRARYPDVPFISTAQLADWSSDSNRRAPVLLDVRAEDEFSVSHLPNTVREVPPEVIPSDRPIVAYCSIGWRSAKSVRRLAQNGHTHVLNH